MKKIQTEECATNVGAKKQWMRNFAGTKGNPLVMLLYWLAYTKKAFEKKKMKHHFHCEMSKILFTLLYMQHNVCY